MEKRVMITTTKVLATWITFFTLIIPYMLVKFSRWFIGYTIRNREHILNTILGLLVVAAILIFLYANMLG